MKQEEYVKQKSVSVWVFGINVREAGGEEAVKQKSVSVWVFGINVFCESETSTGWLHPKAMSSYTRRTWCLPILYDEKTTR